MARPVLFPPQCDMWYELIMSNLVGSWPEQRNNVQSFPMKLHNKFILFAKLFDARKMSTADDCPFRAPEMEWQMKFKNGRIHLPHSNEEHKMLIKMDNGTVF